MPASSKEDLQDTLKGKTVSDEEGAIDDDGTN